jgi:DNA-binding response OmpR family regulator
MRDPWLNGLRVLVVEDEAVISLVISEELFSYGYEVAGPFGRSADALAWLRQNHADLAILDYQLKDGSCVPIARELQQRGIPFMVFSASFPTHKEPPELEGVPWIGKPASIEALLDGLDGLTASPLAAVHLATRSLTL